ncbi:MAG: hypothetical protein ACREP6_09610 [Candidatus Binataceae bacterium]
MKLPIKLNVAGWPSRFARLTFAFDDPRPLAHDFSSFSRREFSAAVSPLQFGVTFKTTHSGRHEHSNRFLLEKYRGSAPVILDVGASDGSTSLDLIHTLEANFSRYFVTDLNLWTRCGIGRGGAVYFSDNYGACVLRASKRFLVYSNAAGASFPLTLVARRLIARSRKIADWRDVLLIQPDLLKLMASDARIMVAPYDMFTPWTGRRPDVIKIACLLNSRYFSDNQMREALQMQCSNLALNGRLLLVSEDDDIEKFSVFRKTPDGMELEHTHAGGAKAAPHVPVADTTLSASMNLNLDNLRFMRA